MLGIDLVPLSTPQLRTSIARYNAELKRKCWQRSSIGDARQRALRAPDARVQRLKSARYGNGGLTLLAWAEAVGTGRNVTLSYFTMVIDRQGAVCQPRTPLDAKFAFTAGDDIVRGRDGKLVWANVQGTAIQVVTLTPG